MSEIFYTSINDLNTIKDKKEFINLNKFYNFYEIFKLACIDNNYETMDSILETHEGSRDGCKRIYHWGLCTSCSETNIHSINYMLSKKIQFKKYNKYTFINVALQKNNKFVLTYLATIKPYISYLSYRESNNKKVFNNKILIDILETKVRRIQQWWKSIYYNPRNEIGKKRLEKEYNSYSK